MKVTAAATRTLSASRATVSIRVALVTLSHVMKSESGASRSVTPPIITLMTAYVPVEETDFTLAFDFQLFILVKII